MSPGISAMREGGSEKRAVSRPAQRSCSQTSAARPMVAMVETTGICARATCRLWPASRREATDAVR